MDSRGNPTVEADVVAGSSFGRSSVPSGASTGKREALELRDGDRNDFQGRGVRKAVVNVETEIGPRLEGMEVGDQRLIDELMIRIDGTPNKSRLGANAILAVSMAVAKAAAQSRSQPLFRYLKPGRGYRLPVPMMNVINGGLHAGNELAVQEFHIEPVGAKSCGEAIRIGSEVYHSLKVILREKYGPSAINVGDEGGFAPPLSKTRTALDAIRSAITSAGFDEADVRMGIDAAASAFLRARSGLYDIDGTEATAVKLADLFVSLSDEYGLLTIEDPFAEDAFQDFANLTRRVGKKTRVIGDDIYTTNVSRISKGIREKTSNAVLIKLNQVGTVTETIEAIDTAQAAGWLVVVSHRSGETEDPFIAHLATAVGSGFIKAGAPARGERTAKYNELLRIEEQLGARASYAGPSVKP